MERNPQRENPDDQIIKCCDCGAGFILTVGERQFYSDRKLNLPKRCSECRRKRRQGKGVVNE
ncbi:MAG TPA: zinc-ribbon domain containing protein [Dehalococcoidia bacterium]|nr:zinc-ribbon domain containing protein [Dehalococcoidia bacterium]